MEVTTELSSLKKLTDALSFSTAVKQHKAAVKAGQQARVDLFKLYCIGRFFVAAQRGVTLVFSNIYNLFTLFRSIGSCCNVTFQGDVHTRVPQQHSTTNRLGGHKQPRWPLDSAGACAHSRRKQGLQFVRCHLAGFRHNTSRITNVCVPGAHARAPQTHLPLYLGNMMSTIKAKAFQLEADRAAGGTPNERPPLGTNHMQLGMGSSATDAPIQLSLHCQSHRPQAHVAKCCAAVCAKYRKCRRAPSQLRPCVILCITWVFPVAKSVSHAWGTSYAKPSSNVQNQFIKQQHC